MSGDVIDFEGRRAYRLMLERRACAVCYEDRVSGGEERYGDGLGCRWLCDRCVAEVDALDPPGPGPVDAA
jgi:hypothetical protein